MLTENEELYNSGMLEYAGKVNFNAASQNGYLTNENYKTLRTNILFCGTDIKTIVLTSARENEGKSTVSAELAKSLAEADKKTVFIDADMCLCGAAPRRAAFADFRNIFPVRQSFPMCFITPKYRISMSFSAAGFRLIRLSF